MLFIDIIKQIELTHTIVSSNSKINLTDVVLNSKNAGSNTIFVAIKGFKTDGHKYIEKAYENGCRNFAIEDAAYIKKDWKNDSTIIITNDSRKAIAQISNILFDFPSNKLKMIGITGTKGKTTVTTLIHHILHKTENTSMFSTIKNTTAGVTTDSERTTMESNELQALLRKSFNAGEKNAIVEVSSHALTLRRVDGIQWDAAIFTSFSRDHLDLYGTMDNYFDAKLELFRRLNNSDKKNKIAIINTDDPKGEEICKIIEPSVKMMKVGKKEDAEYQIKKSEYMENGMLISLNHDNKLTKFKTNIKGEFNITNISLAVAAAMELGISPDEIQKRLNDFPGVEGRFEEIISKPFSVIIDYAHTPDSLEKILLEAKKITSNNIFCVFGCTGERDKEKRSIMGEIAANLSNYSIITNDDTYSEDPKLIASDVEKGFINLGKKIDRDYKIILDRKEAIRSIIEKASKNDVVIIAGMGHEKVQILKNGHVKYSDKETTIEILKEKNII